MEPEELQWLWLWLGSTLERRSFWRILRGARLAWFVTARCHALRAQPALPVDGVDQVQIAIPMSPIDLITPEATPQAQPEVIDLVSKSTLR